MSGSRYWVDILQRGVPLGAGFFVTKRYVLTARHCLRRIDPEDDFVDLRCADGIVVQGRLYYQPHGEVDMALIEVGKPPDVPLPSPDVSTHGDPWNSPYRPTDGDPLLSGVVDDPALAYRCADRSTVEALQLMCDQPLDNYEGYSGSPVERADSDFPALIGILLEQNRDRLDGRRATGVLFAATIRDALNRFDCFANAHLLRILAPDVDLPAVAPAPTVAAPGPGQSMEEMVAAASAFADRMANWVEADLMRPEDARVLMLRVATDIVTRHVSGPAS